jgi:hypothetical protein
MGSQHRGFLGERRGNGRIFDQAFAGAAAIYQTFVALAFFNALATGMCEMAPIPYKRSKMRAAPKSAGNRRRRPARLRKKK